MKTFATWADVLAVAKVGAYLRYHAPLDIAPRLVRVVRVLKNGSIRLDPMTNEASTFKADARHLARLSRVHSS